MFALASGRNEGIDDCSEFKQPKVTSTIHPSTIASEHFIATVVRIRMENRHGNECDTNTMKTMHKA